MTPYSNAIRRRSTWFWLIWALAIMLRVWIATYNTDANDNHREVIQRIKATGELPVVNDCWQCYHVKAYHYPAAVLLARLSINNPVDQLRLLQYGNVLMGLLTLVLIWLWLSRGNIEDKWKLAVFALFALNPKLAAVNTEVTNDSLVILSATASFFCYARFLAERRFLNLWGALVFAALAAASKASGLVVAVVVFGHLAVYAAVNYRRLPLVKKQVAVLVLITAVASIAVPYAGYLQNARVAGSPLANNIKKFPFPSWSEENRWSQAGTVNIVDSYLTFHWPGLVAYPYINKSPVFYPEHRINHWAQVYGRHLFSRFERWPPSWSTNGYWTTRIGRAAMVLGLVPLGFLTIGFGWLAVAVVKGLRTLAGFKALVGDAEIFLGMTALAMIALSLKLSLDFQTYAIMKAIYVYPALIGFAALVMRGVSVMQACMRPAVLAVLLPVVMTLAGVHVLDLSILATDLQSGHAAQVRELAAFEPSSVTKNQVRLSGLEPAEASQVEANRSYAGGVLTGGYKKYRFGYGTHAPSYVALRLDSKYGLFETNMALADEANSSDGVLFEVTGDGKLLYRGPMMIDHQVEHVRLDVSGVEKLGLKVQPLGNSEGDLANWLNPVLTRKERRVRGNVDILTE